jgi:hypothetical protein
MSSPGNAHNRFLKGTAVLSRLYDYSMHCFALVTGEIKDHLAAGTLTAESYIPSKHGFVQNYRAAQAVGQATEVYPKQLRSVVLVRLVSEFEVFLIGQIQESAVNSGEFYRDDLRLDWPRGKIRQFDSIEEIKDHFRQADARSLSSGRLDEVRKYYQKQLGFDICPPHMKMDRIREIHARRHLHVHNLGLVDQEYSREFAPTAEIGTRLGIADEYLRTAFSLLRQIATHVASTANLKFPPVRPTRIYGSADGIDQERILYLFKGKFRDESAKADYFALNRRLLGQVPLETILIGGECNGTTCHWSIFGDKTALKAYFVDLSHVQKKGMLKLVEQRRLSPK